MGYIDFNKKWPSKVKWVGGQPDMSFPTGKAKGELLAPLSYNQSNELSTTEDTETLGLGYGQTIRLQVSPTVVRSVGLNLVSGDQVQYWPKVVDPNPDPKLNLYTTNTQGETLYYSGSMSGALIEGQKALTGHQVYLADSTIADLPSGYVLSVQWYGATLYAFIAPYVNNTVIGSWVPSDKIADGHYWHTDTINIYKESNGTWSLVYTYTSPTDKIVSTPQVNKNTGEVVFCTTSNTSRYTTGSLSTLSFTDTAADTAGETTLCVGFKDNVLYGLYSKVSPQSTIIQGLRFAEVDTSLGQYKTPEDERLCHRWLDLGSTETMTYIDFPSGYYALGAVFATAVDTEVDPDTGQVTTLGLKGSWYGGGGVYPQFDYTGVF